MVEIVGNKIKSTSHVEFLAVGGHMLFMEKLLPCHWLEFFREGVCRSCRSFDRFVSCSDWVSNGCQASVSKQAKRSAGKNWCDANNQLRQYYDALYTPDIISSQTRTTEPRNKLQLRFSNKGLYRDNRKGSWTFAQLKQAGTDLHKNMKQTQRCVWSVVQGDFLHYFDQYALIRKSHWRFGKKHFFANNSRPRLNKPHHTTYKYSCILALKMALCSFSFFTYLWRLCSGSSWYRLARSRVMSSGVIDEYSASICATNTRKLIMKHWAAGCKQQQFNRDTQHGRWQQWAYTDVVFVHSDLTDLIFFSHFTKGPVCDWKNSFI